MIGAAFVVAWGAEAAEFLMSQGLALAILALIQTLPEFAVEAVIAWKAGKDPDMVHLAIANFTGSLRLLTGFGWPMIYAVAAFSSRQRREQAPRRASSSHDDHAVEVLGLLPPLALLRPGLGEGQPLADRRRGPDGDLRRLPRRSCCACRRARRRSRRTRRSRPSPAGRSPSRAGSAGRPSAACSSAGGAIIFLVAEPFLNSMLVARGRASGISQFVFIQWVAPFISEFPEKTSAFVWARRITRAPVALHEHGLLQHQPVGRALGRCSR